VADSGDHHNGLLNCIKYLEFILADYAMFCCPEVTLLEGVIEQ
jgi:hypothetical protein